MTSLRVYLDDMPAADQPYPWCLRDAHGNVVREGQGRPSEWPAANEREAVLAALRGRVSVVALPPLPPARVESAARYALDDRLASTGDDNHVAVGAQAGDGSVRCAIVDRAWMESFREASVRCGIEWQRMVLESDLAAPVPTLWRWCAPSLGEPGFLRLSDGSTIAIAGRADAAGSHLPDELSTALARSGGKKPEAVRVEVGGITPLDCDRWQTATKVSFQQGMPWTWARESSQGAIDLLTIRQPAVVPKHRAFAAIFRPAASIAGIAVLLSLVGATSEWIWLRWQSSRLESQLAAVAGSVLPTQPTSNPGAALASRYADLRHRAGLTVDSDLLPLLARTAPTLSGLPAGALRSLSYSDRHLLLDLQKLDGAAAASLQDTLQRSGLVALAAATSTGARMRIGTD